MLSSMLGMSTSSVLLEEELQKKKAQEKEEEENALRCLQLLRGLMEINHVVYDMFKYNCHPTILELLCDELNRFKLSEIEFYLPQLCNLLLTLPHEPNPVKEWLIGLCSKSIHFALRTYLIVRAASEDAIPETVEQARILEQRILRLVLGPTADEEHISFWLDEITLIKTLTRLSSNLNAVPLEQKNTALRGMLEQLNAGLSVGLYIPIARADEPYSCVMSIVPEDCFCLPTRTRTPFMMFMEVAELGGTFSTLETSLSQYRKDNQAASSSVKSSPMTRPFKGVAIHNAKELMSRCKEHPEHAEESLAVEQTSDTSCTEESAVDSTVPPTADSTNGEAEDEAKQECKASERLHARKAREPQVFDYEQLLAAMEEQKKEWAQYMKDELSRASGTTPSPSTTPTTQAIGPEGQQQQQQGKGILALSEKLKTIVTKVETDKEALLSEIAALQEVERIEAVGDTPLGDDYFIASVEEFYCDVEKGELKMSKQTARAAPTPYLRAKAPHRSFDDDELISSEDADDWVVVSGTEKDMRRTRYELMTTAYKELWADRKKRIQQRSTFGGLPGWNLLAVIVKSEDDLRQEQMAMQLIKAFHEIFQARRLPLWLRPYEIVAASSSTGFIEVVPDAISIDAIKRRNPECPTLAAYFVRTYGERHTPTFKAAVRNFVESLAGYSLVCYFLQIKDRHNGNILLDIYGHIVHIDYGFLLGTGPGTWVFEKAPFKLNAEYVELMGGETSDTFRYFSMLFISGFLEVRNHFHRVINIVEMMLPGHKINCLNETTVPMLLERFKRTLSPDECQAFAQSLITESLGSWRTKHYDNYQLWTNGILP